MKIKNADDYSLNPELTVLKYRGWVISRVIPGVFYYRKTVGTTTHMGKTSYYTTDEREALESAIREIDEFEAE